MGNQEKLRVYYDGLCKVCSTEINHYKRQQGADGIDFVDICAVNFDAAKEQVDPVQVHKIMHARRSDGSLATRVDAFIEIWNVLPKYKWLAKLARQNFVRFGLDVSYAGFTKIRPWLPRYAANDQCKDSPYCEVNK